MDVAKLRGELRETGGSRAARRLRRQGKLPGVIYGHRQPPEHVVVAPQDLKDLLDRGTHVVELSIGGAARSVLIKDVQYDPVGISLVHVDFMRIDLHERVTVSVPLEFKGTPVGTHEGGIFEEQLVDLAIETLALSIPESIRVNVGDLKLGEVIHVKDLALPAGVTAVTPGESIVCSVRAKATAEVEAVPAAEEPTQPEIITARQKEEEAEEEQDKKK